MKKKNAKRQTFALNGNTYMYRITEASIRHELIRIGITELQPTAKR